MDPYTKEARKNEITFYVVMLVIIAGIVLWVIGDGVYRQGYRDGKYDAEHSQVEEWAR